MSSEWELDEGIKSIKSAWRREHTARTNLEKMLEQAEAENAKLRDALKALMMGTNAEMCADRDESDCKKYSMNHGKDGCAMVDAMELLGIDMFGESLGVKS